ncbi:MAG: circularly permuted type 2 ATP-grasp protein, partial [Cellulomonadaceae bacterium]|nr:circularly permuted type 2 ATP-grasp protein [Cellulomonadaceae bacterium]
MFSPTGVRQGYQRVHKTLAGLTAAEVKSRADALARSYIAQGVTFDYAGEERPFPLDVVPRVIEPKEWDIIDRGVKQRIRTLEAFLADVYGPQNCVKDGVVPLRLIMSSVEYKRVAHGIEPPNGVRCHISGIDIVRDDAGTYRVLEDNVRTPSGVSYVMANRRAMVRSFPELFSSIRVRQVNDYPEHLLRALIAAAPRGVPDPTVVILTPGVYNSAYFEHTLLARMMGVELVEGRDLLCNGGQVYMRTTKGPRRVDVIYRRVDDEFLDPVQFRADSMLGVAGLMGCVRRGRVTLVNAVGNGVADDKLTYTYVPDLVRYYLGEEPILKNVDTWRLEDPAALE